VKKREVMVLMSWGRMNAIIALRAELQKAQGSKFDFSSEIYILRLCHAPFATGD
jgi:hypothetical protein